MAKNRARATQGNALSQHQAGVDTPCYIDARTRYDAAMKAVGPWLGASQWGRLNGRSLAEGVLRLALDASIYHYSELWLSATANPVARAC
jgi:hypothetical protein